MADEEKNAASVEAGSAGSDPVEGEAGQSGDAATTTPPQGDGAQNYAELEKKFGEQGKELGDYREFFKNLTPVLNKLDASPELIQAILNDKIDGALAKAILDGKVKVEEAEQITQANKEVQKEMGQQAYGQATPEEIEKRITEKISGLVEDKLTKRFTDADEEKDFESRVNNFIASTADFAEYADKIEVWLNEHPDQDDIEVAYDAVKGKILLEKLSAEDQKAAGEAAKGVAANAGGGTSSTTGKPGEKDIWDELVAPKADPNRL